jgi:hypothetical protein
VCDMIKIYIGLHVKYASFLLEFNEILFFENFSKNTQITNFMKIRPVAAGQT